MKRILYFFTLAAALMAVSCQRELPGGEENLPLVYGDVNVSLGQADPTDADGYATKSLISVDTEDFVDAYLFAFNASTKKILTYTDGTPMAIYTTSKTFDWTLAIGTKMDIWVVANPGTGNAWKTTLQSAVTNASLTESDLSGDKLMFKCASSSALKALETSGAHLPMSAMENGITLTSPTQSLSIKVKRLFAKYNIYLDTSLLEAEGYTIKSTYLASSKSNTEVPFFYQTDGVLGGYAQTDVSKLATIDRNTEEDLTTLENGQKVTLYFLENCQGTKTGASKWSSVYNDLGASAVELCSYMEVGVNVSRSSSSGKEPVDMSYAYRIYLGKTDMKSDFNVQRNLFKTIKLTLPVPEGDVITEIIDGFKFTNTNSLSVAPGETITVPFETSVNTADDISYKIFKNGVEDNTSFSKIEPKTFKANTTKKTGFAYEGTVALTASSSANEGTYDLKGIASSFTDNESIYVSNPLVLNTITVYSADVYKNGAVNLVFSNSKELLSPVILSLFLGPTTLKVQLMPGDAKTWTPMRAFCVDGASEYNRLCGYFGTPATNNSISCKIYSASIPSDLNYKYTVNCSGNLNIKGQTVTTEQSYYKLVIQPIGSGPDLVKKLGYTLKIITIKRDTDITIIDYIGDRFVPNAEPENQVIKQIIAKSQSTGETYTINPYRAFYSYQYDPTNVYFGADYYAGGCLYNGLPIYRLDYDWIDSPFAGYETWDCIQNYPAGSPGIDLPSNISDLSFISWEWGENGANDSGLYPTMSAKRVIEFHM